MRIGCARRLLLALTLLALGCDSAPPVEVADDPDADAAPTREVVLDAAPWFRFAPGWSEEHAVLSPNAKIEAHALALAEAEAPRHPGDGAGRAWVEAVEPIGAAGPGWRRAPGDAADSVPSVVMASRHRFTIVFEVGAPGIDAGGLIFLYPEPFWEWSPSQLDRREREGFVEARIRSGAAGGVTLVLDPTSGGFRVAGGRLDAGAQVELVYGAGPRGAIVDRYADRAARIIVATDANADGFRRAVRDGARVDVIADRGHMLVANGPAERRPGEAFEVVVALVDRQGNRARWPGVPDDTTPHHARFDVEVLTTSDLSIADPSTRESVSPDGSGAHRLRFRPASDAPGVLRLRLRGRDDLEGAVATLPPIVFRAAVGPRLVWADLHGHTALSDGTGTPQDYLAYAEEVARLDVVALTDHDHWGVEALDENPEAIARLFATIDAAERPGRFVTLPGYEWTSWLHGHRHVLYFDPPVTDPDAQTPTRPLFSAVAKETDRPDELWDALRGHPALTFAHHSAGEPVATNWYYPPDPVLEPVTEIVSAHGQSEAADGSMAVRGALPGQFVRDVLTRGARLGFVGSGDSHDGHPGLVHIASGSGGLAGLFVDELDRDGVRDALRRRATFATNGIRPWLTVELDGAFMGSTIESPTDPSMEQVLRVRYEATRPLESVEFVRSGRIARIDVKPESALSLDLERRIPPLRPGEFQYVRFVEEGGGTAWSSPIFAIAIADWADDAEDEED